MALTPFARLEQRVSASIDRLHAERVRIEPKARDDFGGGADPDRQAYELSAVVDFKPVIVGARASTRYAGDVGPVAAEEFHISVSQQALPANRALWPRKADEVRLLDRGDQPIGHIMVVEPDGIGRVVLKLQWVKG